MSKSSANPCSPYLRQPRRSLPEACRDVTHGHAAYKPPCATCHLVDICARSTAARPLAEARPRAMARPAEDLAHRPYRHGGTGHIPGRRRVA